MIKRNFNLFILAALLGGVLMSAQSARAQLVLPGGATFDLLGPPGLTTERKVNLKAKDGPFSVITGQFGLPAGTTLDWHVNPGVAIMAVTKGLFNENRGDGCVLLFEAGDVFFEDEGEVHRVFNPSASEPAEALITFIVPVGSDLVTFVPPPAEKPCVPAEDSHSPRTEVDVTQLEAKADALALQLDFIKDVIKRLAAAHGVLRREDVDQ
jgi:quercetin dioxygenase-like cupin family protein